jgi:cytoskeletal protein RodZ
MPVVIIQRDQGSKKPDEKKPKGGIQSVTAGGVFSDVKTVVAIVGGVVLLLVGLLGWSQGWFGGAAPVPASSQPAANASSQPAANASSKPAGNASSQSDGNASSQSDGNAAAQPEANAGSPMDIGPESNPMGNKRNKDLGQ